MKLENKVSVITGAARGIGKEVAMLFAEQGSDLAICDVNEEVLAETKAEIEEKTHREVLTAKVDVTSIEDVENFIKKILDNFSSLDILVNNAGITRDNLLMKMSESEWDTVLDVNLKGAFNCTKAVTRPLMKQKKGGLIALTKTVAKELGSRNINANAIAPGFIKTDMTDKLGNDAKNKLLDLIPLRRMGEARDVAKLALFLASEEADYITGQVVKVDGGMVM